MKNIEWERAQEKKKREEKAAKALIEFKKKHGDFWKHPEFENCYIPIEIRNVPSKDKVNGIGIWIEENGEYSTPMTLVARIGGEDLSKKEYLSKYCIPGDRDKDGNVTYYFIGENMSLQNIKNTKDKFKSIWKYVSRYLNNMLNQESDNERNDENDENDENDVNSYSDSDDSDINSDDYIIT